MNYKLLSVGKYMLGIVGLMLILQSCGSKLEEEVVASWPDGSVQKVFFFKQKGDVREKVAEESFYENGQKEMHGEFLDNQRHGLWTYWFDDGKKWSESAYEHDLRIGKAVVFREGGVKNYEGFWSKGKPHGQWTFFDTDGSKNKDVFFEHGTKIREHLYKDPVPFNPQNQDSVQFKVR